MQCLKEVSNTFHFQVTAWLIQGGEADLVHSIVKGFKLYRSMSSSREWYSFVWLK